MEYEKCKECPLEKSCNLIYMHNEHQCTVNRDYLGLKWGVDTTKTVTTRIEFESDIQEDKFENGIG